MKNIGFFAAVIFLFLGSLIFVGCLTPATTDFSSVWTLDSTNDWKRARRQSKHLSFSENQAKPDEDRAQFRSTVKTFSKERKAKWLVVRQQPSWDNWTPRGNLKPSSGGDAPIFIAAGSGEYWYLNAQDTGGVYGAWHSSDMKNWTHYEEVIGEDWVTDAEYANGRFFIYYDQPNDEDPHLIIDDDLTDGEHRDVGVVFQDPSHGSDSGIFREEDGTFHLIYEDWSPINAKAHSWDSPLAGHAYSPDGIHGFEPHEFPAPIDERTAPTTSFETFRHPNGDYTYHKHTGEQSAYGDYAMIKVGQKYYLFCDHHPAGESIRLGYWTSDTLTGSFTWGGDIGPEGIHPDPTIGFAENKFYLFAQEGTDYVSSGPWVDQIQARAGVDTTGDGAIDRWTSWQVLREQYSRKSGFAKIVERKPARLDLSSLPAGTGFSFELRIDDNTDTQSTPVIDRVSLSFHSSR